MVSIISYITLYLKEYIKYIFDNLESMDNISKKEKEEIKRSLLWELNKTIYLFVNTFKPDINAKSTTKMRELTDFINETDKEHKVNFYEIILDNSHIQIEGNEKDITLSIVIGDLEKILIRQVFNLEKYRKTKDFNVLTEAYTPNYINYYLVLGKGKILIYNKETINKISLTGFDRKIISFPDDIKIVGDCEEIGFFNYLNDINSVLITDSYNSGQKTK